MWRPYSDDQRTGLDAVDRVLDAMIARDGAALRELVRFSMVPCVAPKDENFGILLVCVDGEQPGTIYRVFLVGKGAPPQLPGDIESAGRAIDNVIAAPLHTIAVYRTAGTYREAEEFQTAYAIVFVWDEPGEDDPNAGFTVVLDRDGGLRELFPAAPMLPENAEYILPVRPAE